MTPSAEALTYDAKVPGAHIFAATGTWERRQPQPTSAQLECWIAGDVRDPVIWEEPRGQKAYVTLSFRFFFCRRILSFNDCFIFSPLISKEPNFL